MRITIDTNVFYQALRNNSGASYFILKLIRERKLELALSIPVFIEYEGVLLRQSSLKDLGLKKTEIDSFLDLIILFGSAFDINFLMRPNLRDENDNIFVELAFASRSKFLITSNVKDYTINKELLFDSFALITPADFVKFWRKYND